MGDMSGLSSLMGGTGISSLFGGDMSGMFGGGDMSGMTGGDGANFMNAMDMATDPTGSTGAISAITGGTGATPAGTTPDLGGTQSGTTPGQGQPQPQAPPPPPQAPAPVPPMVAASDTSQGPFSPQQQANVPGPTGFTPAQQQTGANMLRQGMGANPFTYGAAPISGLAGTPFSGGGGPQGYQAGTYGVPQSKVPGTYPGTPDITGGAGPDVGSTYTGDLNVAPDDTSPAPAASGGAGAPATTGTAASKSAPASDGGTVAGGTKPNTAAPAAPGAGGMPNIGNIGNIMKDIFGLMSGNPQSLGSLIQDLMRMSPQMGGQQQAGQAAAPWLAQGGRAPPGTNPMNYAQATPEQIQQYRQTGRLPAQAGNGGSTPAAQNQPTPVRTQNVSRAQAPTNWLPGPQGVGAANWTVDPATGERILDQARTTTPQRTAPPGQTTGSAANAPGSGATNAAPSRRADGSLPSGKSAVTPIVASTLRAAGLPNAAIQGILYNISAESGFNSSLRHPDQPRWGGEAHYAHGLYQEGAENWNRYANWLRGRDWRDPQLQTQFLAANLKTHYPQLWNKLRNTPSPAHAAADFVRDYLRPSPPNLLSRLSQIRRGAVGSFGIPQALQQLPSVVNSLLTE